MLPTRSTATRSHFLGTYLGSFHLQGPTERCLDSLTMSLIISCAVGCIVYYQYVRLGFL